MLNGGTTGANDVTAQATADSRCNVHGVGCEQNQRRRVFAKPKLGRHLSVRCATDQLEVWIASTDRIEYHLVIEIDRCEQQASPGGRAAKLRSTLFQHFIRNRGGIRFLAVSDNCRQHDVTLRVVPKRRARAATLVLDQRTPENACGSRDARVRTWCVEGVAGNPAPTFRAPFDISGGRRPARRGVTSISARKHRICAASADSHFTTRCGTQSALRLMENRVEKVNWT